MAQARGAKTVVNVYEESTYATAPGAPDGKKLYYKSFGVQSTQALLASETIRGDRGREEPDTDVIDVAGPISCEVGPENIGLFLKHLLGSVNTSGVNPYTHVITPGDLPVGLLLEKDNGASLAGSGRFEQYLGCRIARARFKVPSKGRPEVSFDIKGAKLVQASAALDASITDTGFTPFAAGHVSTIEEGGAAIASVLDLEMMVDNDLDEDQYVVGGGGVRADLPEGFALITGKLTARFDSLALLTKAIAATASTLKVVLSRGDGLGSAGNESLMLEVTALKYERSTAAIEGPRGLMIELPFQGYASASDAGFKATLKNALAAL